jgi:hypothetical protein
MSSGSIPTWSMMLPVMLLLEVWQALTVVLLHDSKDQQMHLPVCSLYGMVCVCVCMCMCMCKCT